MKLQTRTSTRRGRPLVVIVWSAPLLCEGVMSALDGMANVRAFPAGSGDTTAFLRWFGPEVVVIDTDEEVEAAIEFVQESGAQLVRVFLDDSKLQVSKLQVFGERGWEEPETADAPLQSIREIILERIAQGAF
jgi:hypothetical protein